MSAKSFSAFKSAAKARSYGSVLLKKKKHNGILKESK